MKLVDCDGKPGHYFVTIRRDDGSVSLALGPFTARRHGRDAHAMALGYVATVRRFVQANDRSSHEPWYQYGTSRLPLDVKAPAGKLNGHLLRKAA